MGFDIFLSYHKEQVNIKNKIFSFIEGRGYKIFITNDELSLNIEVNKEKIRNSRLVICIISRDYIRSFECMAIIAQLYEDKEIVNKLVPIIVDDLNLEDIQDCFSHLQYWQQRTKEFYETVSCCYSNDYSIRYALSLHYLINKTLSVFLLLISKSKYNLNTNIQFSNKLEIIENLLKGIEKQMEFIEINDKIIGERPLFHQIQEIKEIISEGQIEMGINKLKGLFERKEVLLLESRYKLLISDKNFGIIKREDFLVERNLILEALVDLIRELEEKYR